MNNFKEVPLKDLNSRLVQDHLVQSEDCIDPYHGDKKHSKYWRSAQTLKPIRFPKKKVPAPIDNTGLFSFAILTWMSRIMYSKKPVDFDDLPKLSKYDSCAHSRIRLERLYQEDKKKHGGKPSLYRTFLSFIKTRTIVSTIVLNIFAVTITLAPPYFLNLLTTFAVMSNSNLGLGLAFALALGLSEFVKTLFFSSYWSLQYRTILRSRGAILSLLFKKLTRIRSLQNKSIGEIVNMLGNDAERITDVLLFGNLLLCFPLQLILASIYCCFLIGWTAMVGIFVFVSFVPLQMVLGRLMAKYRFNLVKLTDTRVRMMNEILTCVKLIKMYAWESSFAESIGKIRNDERNILAKTTFVSSFSVTVIPIVPTAAVVITFLVHTLFRYPLASPEAFTVIALFNSLRIIIAIAPRAVRAIAELGITFHRMDNFLEMEEQQEYFLTPANSDVAVSFKGVTAAWDNNFEENSKNQDEETSSLQNSKTVQVLFDLNLTVKKRKLIGVCGSVGSGKTSLISTILGQLRIEEGSLGLDGTMAYVPQQAWIFHDTARENILFGLPWEEDKYKKVINACSLESDFDILPDNDLTEIGERGINLSGGQKQRVSLARAAYSDRDIVLLDDPLSAVDAHVGKHIFYECIKTLLSSKTVIFVTHQLQYLKDCDEVILLKDGRIFEHGNHDELMKNEMDYAHLINNYNIEQEKNEDSIDIVDHELVENVISTAKSRHVSTDMEHDETSQTLVEENKNKKQMNGTKSKDGDLLQKPSSAEDNQVLHEKSPVVLIKKEKHMTGSVKASTYTAYIKAAGGALPSILLAVLYIITATGTIASNWWLTLWLQAGGNFTLDCENITTTAATTSENDTRCREIVNPDISTSPNISFYQGFYFLIFFLAIAAAFAKAALFSRLSLAASSGLHDKVFQSVMACPMWFFDTTPTGRILNRFSRDLDDVDNRLPIIMDSFLLQFLVVMSSFLSIVVVFPYFALPLLLLAIVFIMLYKVFRRTVRQLKRMDSTARSPWFSHVTSTVQGLSTVHAYEKTDEFVQTFQNLLDRHGEPYYTYYCSTRWLAVRLDFLSITITTTTALFLVFATVYPQHLGETSSAFAGLALSYAITMTGLFQITTRYCIETEALFTSVERIVEYIRDCPSEYKTSNKRNPPESWPQSGDVEFREVSLRYREELPVVLKNVNFKVKSKEKIGIVGRTGSGKSSLGIALFRMVELDSGKVLFDGIDTEFVDLVKLRGNISIIPQDPVLFVGTIRYNLDPFHQYSDDDLWKALERSHMKEMISELPEKLEAEVVENGENFSVGERQLLCMSRAILRHSRVIMLDEATAAIDSKTDSLVQDTIREAFSDCTMLTIAHRLNTVLNCDKILVMENGRVAEFDDTVTLLNNPNSSFAKMVAAASNKRTS